MRVSISTGSVFPARSSPTSTFSVSLSDVGVAVGSSMLQLQQAVRGDRHETIF